MVLTNCNVQRRNAFIGNRINFGAPSYQEFNYGHKTIAGREVQGRPSAILPRINICVLIDEPFYLCKVTVNRGMMQRLATPVAPLGRFKAEHHPCVWDGSKKFRFVPLPWAEAESIDAECRLWVQAV